MNHTTTGHWPMSPYRDFIQTVKVEVVAYVRVAITAEDQFSDSERRDISNYLDLVDRINEGITVYINRKMVVYTREVDINVTVPDIDRLTATVSVEVGE